MNIIFLDIDGVLIPVSPMSMGFGAAEFETSCLQNFTEIAKASGVDLSQVMIVLSSSWRVDPAKIERINATLKPYGFPVISMCTPIEVPADVAQKYTASYMPKNLTERKLVKERVDEILYFLENGKYNVGTWIVVDDMDLGVDPRIKGHFLKANTEDGLVTADVAKGKALWGAVATLPPFPTVEESRHVDPAVTTVRGEKGKGKPQQQQQGKPAAEAPGGLVWDDSYRWMWDSYRFWFSNPTN